jgi:group I intron endonuclease
MKIYKVYKLTSPSNKVYIGWTGRTLKKRLHDHLSEVRRGYQRPIQNALRKYPLEQWKQEVLIETTEYEYSLRCEIQSISLYDSTNPEKGYNLSTGGGKGAHGVTRSDEYKSKMRESKKRQVWRSTPEHGAKISAALKGHPPSEKQKTATIKARAKTYIVVFPDQSKHEIYNLNAFCKQNNLSESNLRTSSSKGYRLDK